MDIAPPDMTSSKCEIVPMRDVLWHSCLRKARWDVGVVTRVYCPPGIAGWHRVFFVQDDALCLLCTPGAPQRIHHLYTPDVGRCDRPSRPASRHAAHA